jgi:hypothetical protein
MIYSLRKRFKLYRDPEGAETWAHYTLVDTHPFVIAQRTRKHYYVQFGTEGDALKHSFDGHLTLPAGMRMRVHHLFGVHTDFGGLTDAECEFVEKWAMERMTESEKKHALEERRNRVVH